jgi:hypothetical protein
VREGVENDLGFDPVLVMESTSGSKSNFGGDGGDGEEGRMVMVEASMSASGLVSVSVVVAAREEAEADAGAADEGATAAGEGVLRARPKVDSQPDADEGADVLPLVVEVVGGGETTVDVTAGAGSGAGAAGTGAWEGVSFVFTGRIVSVVVEGRIVSSVEEAMMIAGAGDGAGAVDVGVGVGTSVGMGFSSCVEFVMPSAFAACSSPLLAISSSIAFAATSSAASCAGVLETAAPPSVVDVTGRGGTGGISGNPSIALARGAPCSGCANTTLTAGGGGAALAPDAPLSVAKDLQEGCRLTVRTLEGSLGSWGSLILEEDERALEDDRVGRRLDCEERRAEVVEDVDDVFNGLGVDVDVDGGWFVDMMDS